MKKNRHMRWVFFLSIISMPFFSSAQFSMEKVADLGYGYGKLNFINETVGFYFCGVSISKTTDGGQTWNKIIPNIQDYTHPDGLYVSGQFVDEMNGWAVLRKDDPDHIRDSSFLYKTTDGGATWELNHINPPNEIEWAAAKFNDVYFKNLNEGWVFGKGLLEYTPDGGETWMTLVHNEGNTWNNDWLSAMCFSDDNTAHVVGYGSTILRSADNGVTWNEQHFNGDFVDYDYYLYDVEFESALVGYAAVGHGYLKKTTDGGLTWDDISTGLVDDNNALCVDAYNTLWSAAGDYCDDTGCYYTAALLYSNDKGETWTTIYDEDEYGRFTDIVWPTAEYGIVSNIFGEIFRIERNNVGLESNTSDRLPVYPNPATDQITVDNTGDFSHATIINAQGEVLMNATESNISVADLAQGIYWVCSYNSKKELISSEKLVIYK